MKRKILLVLIGILLIVNLYGEENKEVYSLLAPIADIIAENDIENRSIAVGKINDDSGRVSVLSNVIADNIEYLLVERGKNKKFNVIERDNLTKIFEEQKLGLLGFISEEKAAKVGNITGVNVFCFIKYRVVQEKTTLFIKLVDCETGEIISSLTKTVLFPYEITSLANKYNEAIVEEDMVLVNGGVFDMGRDEKILKEPSWGRNKNDNIPIHKVKLSDFYIGKYEITYSKFEKFVVEEKYMTDFEIKNINEDYTLEVYKNRTRGEQPVISVTHTDIVRYCNWLSKKNGYKPAYDVKNGKMIDENGNFTTDITKVKGYRLPTEAEWEYAARGGEKSKFYEYSGSNIYTEVGWFIKVNDVQPVGMKKPNELGIYDMSGNVQEMCEDYYEENYYSKSSYENPCNMIEVKTKEPKLELSYKRVFRGGSLGDSINIIYREPFMQEYSGFRIARTR